MNTNKLNLRHTAEKKLYNVKDDRQQLFLTKEKIKKRMPDFVTQSTYFFCFFFFFQTSYICDNLHLPDAKQLHCFMCLLTK